MFRDGRWAWNPLQYAGAPLHYLYPPIFHVLVAAMPVRSIGTRVPSGHRSRLCAGSGGAVCSVRGSFSKGRLLPIVRGDRLQRVSLARLYRVRDVAGPGDPYFSRALGFRDVVGLRRSGACVRTLVHAALHRRGMARPLDDCNAARRCRVAHQLAGADRPGAVLGALAVAKRSSFCATIALGGTAYGLSAFWIAPGYFVSASLLNRVVLRHTAVGAPFNRTAWLVLIASAILIGVALWRRVPARIRAAAGLGRDRPAQWS